MFDTEKRTVVVVGAQWGDEGKGKLVDVLAERADWVVRYQGGANAGHTVHIGDAKFVLRQIPSGILHPGVRCAIGNGVVLDPDTLFAEVDRLVADGIDVEGRLYISDRAHLVLPYHKLLDTICSSSTSFSLLRRKAIKLWIVQMRSPCLLRNSMSSGRRAMVPSSCKISHSTPAPCRPAILARSTAASV